MQTPTIRHECDADVGAIHQVTQLAFTGKPYAGGDEQDVIVRLRNARALSLSLVAATAAQVVGQVTFSPATLSDHTAPWFALGPVAVLPELQGQGIGAALISQGLAEIHSRGALGCILTGNPDYYQRFGFALAPRHAPASEPAEFFMLKLFGTAAPTGEFAFHPAFYGDL